MATVLQCANGAPKLDGAGKEIRAAIPIELKMIDPIKSSVAMSMLERISESDASAGEQILALQTLFTRFAGPLFVHRSDRAMVESLMLGGEYEGEYVIVDLVSFFRALFLGDEDPTVTLIESKGGRNAPQGTSRRRKNRGHGRQ